MFALVVACAIALAGAVRWYGCLLTVTSLARTGWQRVWLGLTPVACLILLQGVLNCCAAHEVREQIEYDLLFLAGGAAWLGISGCAARVMGISPRDDAVESPNAAATAAVCGAWIGSMLCYAGGNIGEGPTIWTTFGPAAMATAGLFVLWLMLELLAGSSEAIVVGRDTASGLRLAGFLMAAGLILGRAVAGDWLDWNGALHDFLAQGWPAAPLTLAAAAFQQMWRPTPQNPQHPAWTRGLLPAGALILVAIVCAAIVGPPNRAGGH